MENEANHSEQIVPAATESTVKVAPAGPPEIRAGSLVVEGVIGGFDAYVFRPVALAGGTAPRLRARSFRVAAIGESIAQRVSERLGLRVLISTGSRFLLAGAAGSGWEETLNTLQREFDGWLFQHLQPPGMLQCWLAGAVCSDDRIPIRELEAHRAGRRLQPLEGALRIGPRWNGGAFVQAAGTNIGECSGCASVTSVHLFGDEHFCETCAADTEIGGRLPTYESAWLCEEREADIACPGGGGVRFSMPAAGGRELRLDQGPWPSLRRLPARDFAEMAGARKLLGFARLNVDGAAAAFEALAGDPGPTLVLAHAIHDYFAGQVLTGFPIYPGDDDVVLIGPWQPTLELAIELGKGFEKLSLSGGFTAVQPQSQVSAAVAQASENLDTARAAGGGRLRVFGETLEWKRAAQLLDTGRRVADWLDRRAISGPWLQRLAELRAFSNNGDSRWRARLAHLVTHTPIRHRQAREWALRLPGTVDHADSDWRWIRFLTRYASLAAPEAGAAEKS